MKFMSMILVSLISYSIQSLADASRIECYYTSYIYHGASITFERIADGPNGEIGYDSSHSNGYLYLRGSNLGTDTFCGRPYSSYSCPEWVTFRSGFAQGVVGDEQTDVEMGRHQNIRNRRLRCVVTEGDNSQPPSSQISDVIPKGTQCDFGKRRPDPRDYAIFAKLHGAVGIRETELSDTSLLADIVGDTIVPHFSGAQKQEIDRMALLGFKPIYSRDKEFRDFVYLDFYYNNSGFIPQAGASGEGSSMTESYYQVDRQLPYYFSNKDGSLVFNKPVGKVNVRCMK